MEAAGCAASSARGTSRGRPRWPSTTREARRARAWASIRRAAPELELRNPAGQARLAAGVTGDDALLIVGDERQAHGVLGAAAGVPLLSFGAGPEARMQLQMAADGRPSVVLAGADGQRSAALSMDSEDAPLLTLYHAGRARVTLGVVQDAAVINVSGPGQSRVVVGVAADGFPSVTLHDEAGEAVGAIP